MKINSKLLFLIFALILSTPGVVGLLHVGFPLTDDGNWMVIRFSAFYEALKSGQFPVRFLMRLNNGYGYPVSDFLYPLFMYLAVPLKILGLSFVDSIKTLLILSLISSSLFSFFWLRKIFDNLSSLVGSVYYTYFPYHLFDIYKRGSVGEVLSLSVLPLVLWQIERKSIVFTSIGIALLITAHNTLAVLFLSLIFLYMFFNIVVSKNKKENLYYFIIIFLFGIGISAFFWSPALLELKFTVFSNASVSNFANYFSNYNLIGIPTLIIIFLTIIFIIKQKINIKKHRLTILMLIVSLFSIFLATSFSSFLWKFLPASIIQFPFRFLSLSIVSISFLAAVLVSVLSKKTKTAVAIILISIVIIFALSFIKVEQYQNYPDTFYSTNQDTTTVKNEYMPKWVKVIPLKMYKSKVEVLHGRETPEILVQNSNKTSFNIVLKESKTVQINTIYFPGWRVYVNGVKKDIVYDNPNGLIRINLDKGENNVEVIFEETPVRLFSDFVSIISLSCLFISYYFLRKKIFKL